MARFSHNQVNNELELESALFKLVGAQLTAMGHQVSSSNGSPVGGFEAICSRPIRLRRQVRAGQPLVHAADCRRVSRRIEFQRRRSSGGILIADPRETWVVSSDERPRRVKISEIGTSFTRRDAI